MARRKPLAHRRGKNAGGVAMSERAAPSDLDVGHPHAVGARGVVHSGHHRIFRQRRGQSVDSAPGDSEDREHHGQGRRNSHRVDSLARARRHCQGIGRARQRAGEHGTVVFRGRSARRPAHRFVLGTQSCVERFVVEATARALAGREKWRIERAAADSGAGRQARKNSATRFLACACSTFASKTAGFCTTM